MRPFICILSFLVFLTAPWPASADDWQDCSLSAPDLRAAACSRIIAKGGLDASSLAAAYRYRAAAFRRKDKDKAVADLMAASRADPSHAAYYRGLIHYTNEAFDKAIAEFGEALKSDPANASIYNSRGAAYSAAGDRDRGMADYSEAIRLDPEFALALSNRGNHYRLKGDFNAALADLGNAIRLRPNYSSAYLFRAYIYGRKGEFDPAIADCSKAIELDPNYADAYDYRGYMHTGKHEHESAITDGNMAIGLNPKLGNAYNNLGIAYAQNGDRERALANFDKAIELSPNFAPPYNNRALIYLSRKVLDRGLDSLNKAIELDPNYANAYYNRGRAYQKKHDNDRALADYRKILELPAPSPTDLQRQEVVRNRIARLTQAQRGVSPPSFEQTSRIKRAALVIGNANYSHAGLLSNPKNDATAMAATLRRLGFQSVIELHDASREKMGQALKSFGDMAEGAEWAVVFFAGHGLEMNGVTYLIPTDAELLRDTHVTDETISLTQVQAKVDAAAKLGLVILDSCRNNPFLSHMARSAGATRAVGQGLANVEPEGNVLVAYSAKHGTTAQDGDGSHSPFTEALLNHIEEPGLEINFLFRKVRDEVRSKTQRQQEPFLYGSLSADPLYFKETVKQ